MRRHWLTLIAVFLLASRVAPAQGPAEKLRGEGVTTGDLRQEHRPVAERLGMAGELGEPIPRERIAQGHRGPLHTARLSFVVHGCHRRRSWKA